MKNGLFLILLLFFITNISFSQRVVEVPFIKDEKIIDKLTDIGLEVEGIKESQSELSDFKIAKVLKAEKHPNADKLKVCDLSLIHI